MDELKQALEEINKTWHEFKATLEQRDEEIKKYGQALADTEQKLERMNERMNELELALKRPPVNAGSEDKQTGGLEAKLWRVYLGKDEVAAEEKQAAFKAFLDYLRKGAVSNELKTELKVLNTADDNAGGYLAPPQFVARMIEDLVEVSPVRRVAQVMTITAREIQIPKRTGVIAAQWVGERGTVSDSEPKFGLETVRPKKLEASVPLTTEMIEDSAFDIEAYVRQNFAEQFAAAEGIAFISGSGNLQPEGLLTNSSVAEDTTGSASGLTYDGLVAVSHNLKAVYARNARFAFSLKTLGEIRKIKDANGNPIFAPMQAGAPSTVLGFPYEIWPDMPDVAANAYPVLFGDFRRAYIIVDRVSLSIMRDPYSRKKEGIIEITGYRRVTGQVVLPQAVRKLKVA